MSRFISTSRRSRLRRAAGRSSVRRRGALLLSALTAATLLTAATGLADPPAAHADQSTQGNDNLRTNWDSAETGLSPAAVQSSAFGRLFATKLDGQVYAQPLVIGDQVIAVTESNTVYGLDRTTGAVRWSRNYGPAWPASAIGCGDLTPSVGATATPVYDPASGTLYFTTKVDDGTATHRHPNWLMHAVDPNSGAERAGWPVTIAGSPSNDPASAFDAFYEQQRPGLLLLDGVVYAGFGGHCDAQPYRGYVVGVSAAQHRITAMWASETGASVSGAGIWQSGGGLVSDGPGRIFFSTGNGISPAPGPGTTPQGTLSESVVRLQVGQDGSLSTADFFAPANAPTLDMKDQDISSGAPMALPDGFGTAAHPHVLVQQGKDGRIFLLDRDGLGGMAQGPGGGDAVLSVTGPYQGLWGHPAFWGGNGGYVYVVGNNGPLRALKYGSTSGGLPTLTLTGQSQDTFGYTSGSPLITSSGTDASTAVLWMVSATNASGTGGTLRAYRPMPDGQGLLPLLWSAPIGTATKFSTPTANAGKVYVGTRDGFLYGFGSPARTDVTASTLDFGSVAAGSTAHGTMTLTATVNTSITGLSAGSPFAVDPAVQPTPAKPIALAAGHTLDVPVTFTPAATGGINGTLTVDLAANSQHLGFGLHGVGTRPGFAAEPGSLDFGTVPTGSATTLNVEVTNTGTAPETVTAVTAPTGPFSATGLPAAGTAIPVGGSFVTPVTYTPAEGSTQPDAGSLVVTSSSGGATHTLTVPVAGSPVTGRGHLEFSTPQLAYGTVQVGTSRTLTFTVTNTGNLPVTVTKAKAPTGDFSSPVPLSEGLVIGPDQTAVQQVVFTPRSSAAQNVSYEVTGTGSNDDGSPQGAMYLPITGTGSGSAVTTSGRDGTWRANGSAVLADDGSLQLTQGTPYQAGSAVMSNPVSTEGLRATFTVQLGPGTGADGVAFALLDPGENYTDALGSTGAGLGVAGRPGVVVGLADTWNSSINMANYVGIGYTTAGSTTIDYQWAKPVATSLRQGTHQVDVAVTGGHLTVAVDGVVVLDGTPVLPTAARLAFTAGTGLYADVQTVSGPVISAQRVFRMLPAPPPPQYRPPTQKRTTGGGTPPAATRSDTRADTRAGTGPMGVWAAVRPMSRAW